MSLTYVSAFNNQFLQFCDDLITIFPHDNDIKAYKNTFSFIMKSNVRKICNMFYTNITKIYKDKINNKEETFFLENNYDYIINGDSGYKDLMLKLKQYWNNLSNENKDSVWKYFQLFCALTLKIYEE